MNRTLVTYFFMHAIMYIFKILLFGSSNSFYFSNNTDIQYINNSKQINLCTYEIRSLKDRESFKIDCTDLDTVSDMMIRIIKIKNLKNSFKLIYSGKILKPESVLSDINYKSGIPFVFLEGKEKLD